MSIEDVLSIPPEELTHAQLGAQLALLELAYETAQRAYDADPTIENQLARAAAGEAFTTARNYWRDIRSFFSGVAGDPPALIEVEA